MPSRLDITARYDDALTGAANVVACTMRKTVIIKTDPPGPERQRAS
ncbi:hypothetical protein [Caulobacter mirabilis]|nr:hypothetical protein [Caulobacter mirabilis]